MGPSEIATATTGAPRVIDVFDGNGAPSGPNYLLFSDADRLADPLWDRSGVGWSPMPHTPSLQQSRALGLILLKPRGLLREIGQKCLKRRRMRRRRLHVYSTDPRRPQGDLLGRD